MKKVTIEVKVKLEFELADGFNIDTDKLVQELDYNFTDGTGLATVINTEIVDQEVIDGE